MPALGAAGLKASVELNNGTSLADMWQSWEFKALFRELMVVMDSHKYPCV